MRTFLITDQRPIPTVKRGDRLELRTLGAGGIAFSNGLENGDLFAIGYTGHRYVTAWLFGEVDDISWDDNGVIIYFRLDEIIYRGK